jgi:hypothetical protein
VSENELERYVERAINKALEKERGRVSCLLYEAAQRLDDYTPYSLIVRVASAIKNGSETL